MRIKSKQHKHRRAKANTQISRIVATKLPRLPSDSFVRGRLQAGPLTLPCALGAAAITHRKREGDHASPAGHFRLIEGFFKPATGRRPRARLPMFPINRTLGWCDDPDAANYNRLVRLPSSARHEMLWREDGLYDLVVILDYNVLPRRKGAGSAIFLHCAQADFAPTEGCIALREADLRRLLPRLARAAKLIVRR